MFSKQKQSILIAQTKTATGELSLPVADIKARLVKESPAIAGEMPEEIYLQVLHLPHERGERFGLDAWTAGTDMRTGGLYTLPVKLSITKW